MNETVESKTIGLSSQVRYRAVGDEGVLIHLENGRVIVVNEVGLHIVQQLKKPTTRNDLAVAVAAEFEVSFAQAAEDLDLFLAELDQDQILDGTEYRPGSHKNV